MEGDPVTRPVRRTYVVVVDPTPESRIALRFAARRAHGTGGRLRIIHVVPPTEFVQWGAVQSAIEEEAHANAEALLSSVSDEVFAWTGERPETEVRRGPAPQQVMEAVTETPGIGALVLGAAERGTPGPLVAYFTGERAGALPCLLIIVPGALGEAGVDALA